MEVSGTPEAGVDSTHSPRNLICAMGGAPSSVAERVVMSFLAGCDRSRYYPSMLVGFSDRELAVRPEYIDQMRLLGVPVLIPRSIRSSLVGNVMRDVTDAHYFIRSSHSELLHIHANVGARLGTLMLAARLVPRLKVLYTEYGPRSAEGSDRDTITRLIHPTTRKGSVYSYDHDGGGDEIVAMMRMYDTVLAGRRARP